MPRPKPTVPKYYVDSTGRAFTKVDGRKISLGLDSDSEAHDRFVKIKDDCRKGLARAIAEKSYRSSLTINELLLLFVEQELPRFSSSERDCQSSAIRILRETFGITPIDEFGPNRLRQVRDAMIAGDEHATDADGSPKPRKPWSRKTVNRQVKRIQAIFRWGVSIEVVPADVATRLSMLRMLRKGETSAAEAVPRMAVADSSIEAVRAELKPLYLDVFELLRLTAARPGEILKLTSGMIDRRGEEWVVELMSHKNQHKDKPRYLIFNRPAQAILLRHLKADPDARLFPVRVDTFGTAVKRACRKAKVAEFCPHRLRHTAVTKVVEREGLDVAQAVAGHSSAEMTRLYSRAAIEPAKRGARALDDAKQIG